MSTKRSRSSPVWDHPFHRYEVWVDEVLFIQRRRLQCPWFAILVSRIHRDDQKRDPHTHRRSFITIAYKDTYTERVFTDPADLTRNTRREHKTRRPYLLRRCYAHQITSVSEDLRTIVIAGRAAVRDFDFWTPQGLVESERYEG